VSGRVSSLAVDPETIPRICCSCGRRRHLGEPRYGRDLVALHRPPAIVAIVRDLDPTAPSRRYAAAVKATIYSNLGAGVLQVTDGGSTWTAAASTPFVGVRFFDLVVDPQTPSILYGATPTDSTSDESRRVLEPQAPGMCWDSVSSPRRSSSPRVS